MVRRLAFLLLAACSPTSSLPDIPPYLDAPAGKIAIGKADSLLEKRDAYGESNFARRTIVLDSRLSRNTAWLTLEHERVHFILWDSGVRVDDETEERIADVIAQSRVAEMLR
jgi:outer membrane biogenesis lipoprotein LolB